MKNLAELKGTVNSSFFSYFCLANARILSPEIHTVTIFLCIPFGI